MTDKNDTKYNAIAFHLLKMTLQGRIQKSV